MAWIILKTPRLKKCQVLQSSNILTPTCNALPQIDTLKDPMASSHWLFTSPTLLIAITILVVVVTFFTQKKCSGRSGMAVLAIISTSTVSMIHVEEICKPFQWMIVWRFVQTHPATHWQNLLAIMPVTALCDYTCFGHLGRRDRDSIISIFCCIAQGVAVTSVIVLNFSNRNTA